MVDITHKTNTLRIATAQAIVKVGDQQTIHLIQSNQIPKGNVFEMAKTAGLLGVKKTPELLPDCHPLPIEYTGVEFEIEGLTILIKMTVKTIYKTGVEVEAMHGASVVALTLYDMLKPVDKQVEIESIKLLEKKGGKTSYPTYTEGLSAQVVVCSDRVSRDENEDKTGKLIVSKMEGYGLTTAYEIIPNEPSEITRFLNASTSDLVIFTGGVGVAPEDRTSETIRSLLDTTLPGVEEEMRRYGQERMHYAMLSRSVAGIKNGSVVLAFSGSIQGVTDGLSAVFPHLFHIFPVLKGERHD